MAAYLLAVCEITNMTDDMKKYAQKSAELIDKHGGKYIIRGHAAGNYEGDLLEGKMIIMSEWPTMDDLKAFIDGDEYRNEVKHLRDGTGNYHIAYYEGMAS